MKCKSNKRTIGTREIGSGAAAYILVYLGNWIKTELYGNQKSEGDGEFPLDLL